MSFGYRTRKGEDAPNARLNATARAHIKERRAAGATYAQIAEELSVCVNTVRNAERGWTYSEDE